MKFECKKDILRNKLQLLDRVTGKNLSLPILNNILIEATKSNLILKATNLEVGVEVNIPAKVENEGVVAVDGKVITSFLNSIDGGDTISIQGVGNNISITTKGNSTIINTYPIDEFPNIPKTAKNKVKIENKVLVEGIRSVWFSVSLSDIKPEIASVLIYSKNSSLFFVATDSFRLSEKEVKNIKTNIEPTLIPQKSALEIIRFFEETEEELTIYTDKNQLSVESKDTYLTTRLTDGVYPDYKQILPTSSKTKVVVLTKEITQALKTAGVFVDEFNKLSISVLGEDNIIEIESKNQKTGENTTQIDAHITGDDIKTSFNYRYINDVFQTIHTDSISFELGDQNKPLLITPVGDQTFKYLVMPVNR